MEDEYIKDEYIKDEYIKEDELEGESIKKTKYKQYIKIIMLMIIPLIFTVIIYLNPKLKNKLLKNVNFIKSNNKNTTVIFIIVIILLLVNLLLHWQFISNIIIGYIFGLMGIPIGLFITIVSSSISYYISRYITDETILLKDENKTLIKVIISRILFPHHLTSYFWGSTNISFTTFFIGTLLIMIPITIIEVYMGSLLNNITELKNKMFKSTNHKYYIILLLILIVIGYIVIKKYKKVINTRKEKDVN